MEDMSFWTTNKRCKKSSVRYSCGIGEWAALRWRAREIGGGDLFLVDTVCLQGRPGNDELSLEWYGLGM